MKEAIHSTNDVKLACTLYNQALEVDKQNTLFGYIMATQELQPTATTDIPTEQNKENPDDNVPLFKTAHNNPKEAAAYVKDITKLVYTFMSSVTGYDRYAQADAYEYFVFNLSR